MKKIFLSLMLAAAACTASYANGNVKNGTGDDNVSSVTIQDLKRKVSDAPAGTTYGVVQRKNGNVVVNTPLGRYAIVRENDGSYSFMGMKVRLVSARNGVYVVRTSLGTWEVNTRNCTLTKK